MSEPKILFEGIMIKKNFLIDENYKPTNPNSSNLKQEYTYEKMHNKLKRNYGIPLWPRHTIIKLLKTNDQKKS